MRIKVYCIILICISPKYWFPIAAEKNYYKFRCLLTNVLFYGSEVQSDLTGLISQYWPDCDPSEGSRGMQFLVLPGLQKQPKSSAPGSSILKASGVGQISGSPIPFPLHFYVP